MKKNLITLSLLSIAIAASGCSTNNPNVKSVKKFSDDLKFCENKADMTFDTLKISRFDSDFIEHYNLFIESCLIDNKKWTLEEIDKMSEKKRMLEGDWGFDHDSMQP